MSKLRDMWLMDIREMIERQDAQKKTESQTTQSRKLEKKRRRKLKT